jgi:hypothetical protein
MNLRLRMLKFKFYVCLAVVREEFIMAWWRKGSKEEDETYVEAASILLDCVADADGVNLINQGTGRNMRDQLTIEEAEEMYKEARLRGQKDRN